MPPEGYITMLHDVQSRICPPPQGGGGEGQGSSHGASRGLVGGPPQGYMTSGHQVLYSIVHCSVAHTCTYTLFIKQD